MSIRPNSDITAPGWTSGTGGSLFDAVNEDTPDDGDYVLSPELSNPTDAILGLDDALQPGTYRINIRASITQGGGTMSVALLDNTNFVLGSSSAVDLTGSPVTYQFTITIAAPATRLRIRPTMTTNGLFYLGSDPLFLGSTDVLRLV